MADDFEEAVREARRFPYLVEARTVRCPECKTALGEYLYGVLKLTCRHCRWNGVIKRPAAGQRVHTVRPGQRRDTSKEG